MLVFLKKVGMFVLFGMLFIACSSNAPKPSSDRVVMFSNICKTKVQKKVCPTCVASIFQDDKS